MGAFRSTLFAHQDGVALGMILAALSEKGLDARLFERSRMHIGELAESAGASRGYVNVALRCLASQGWIRAEGAWDSPDLMLESTESGRVSARAFPLYVRAASFVRTSAIGGRRLDARWLAQKEFSALVEESLAGWGLSDEAPDGELAEALGRCALHLDGLLVVPVMTFLQTFGKLDEPVLVTGKGDPVLGEVLRLFRDLGWIEPGTNAWTSDGETARSYASHYALMGSTLPLLASLGERLYRKPSAGDQPAKARQLDVPSSAVAHQNYFRDSEALFIDLFDAEPLDSQPSFVADMGCGDGTWLVRLYKLIATTTRRGRALDTHPLQMVGADFDPISLEMTREQLEREGVPHLVLEADVSDPDGFAEALAEHGLEISDGLHIRSFMDHNRRYIPPAGPVLEEEFAPTGTYVDEAGDVIPPASLEQNLVEHFQRWVPHVERHGMVILESHTVEPRIAARHLGLLHNIAFDTYHGYARQYPTEFEVFMRAAEKAGLSTSSHDQIRYPSRLPCVAISLNRFSAATESDPIAPLRTRTQAEVEASAGWRPVGDEDLSDGESLHQFLYEDGSLQKPRRWASGATGVVVRLVLDALRARLEEIRQGRREPRISILDYGTGTGLAALELIKACRRMGIFETLEGLGIEFELHLLDLPTGWFAKGFELLSGCDFVRFHSLRDPDSRGFVPLADLVGERSADIVMASMVFHLVPSKAMPEVARNLASALKPDGELIWNTPDTGPPGRGARLFHEPNRRVRQAALQVIDNDLLLRDMMGEVPDSVARRYAGLPQALAEERAALTPERRAACEQAANRQILPRASEAPVLEEQLGAHLQGEIFTRTFEMRMQDTIDAILVPSNQRYLGEIENFETRALLSEMLMKYHVLPTIYAGPAATAYGFNLHWTFGRHRPRA